MHKFLYYIFNVKQCKIVLNRGKRKKKEQTSHYYCDESEETML